MLNKPNKFKKSAIDLRHEEIRKLMNLASIKKKNFLERIEKDDIDENDARYRNGFLNGSLGLIWLAFINLDRYSKIKALKDDVFNGVSWQSLLQCNPYLKDSK